jgi:nucleoid-associated protein YgaU
MLEKLKIVGLMEVTESSITIPFSIYFAMFNPEKFSVSQQVYTQPDNRSGSTGSENRFGRITPRSFSFEFLIDGTGASGEKRIVELDIKLFKLTTGYIGDTHRTAYLIISWGTFIARCVLKSLTVNYTLFDSTGIPLRATLNASFEEYVTPQLELLQNFLSSPDVTHERTVTANDRLDLMSYKIYKDSKYYMELARVNNLNQFKKLKVGEKIIFPPIEKAK